MSKIVNKMRLVGYDEIVEYFEVLENILDVDEFYSNHKDKITQVLTDKQFDSVNRLKYIQNIAYANMGKIFNEIYNKEENALKILLDIQFAYYMLSGGKPINGRGQYDKQYIVLLDNNSLEWIIKCNISDLRESIKKEKCIRTLFKMQWCPFSIDIKGEDLEKYKVIVDMITGKTNEFENNKIINSLTALEKLKVLEEITDKYNYIVDIADKEYRVHKEGIIDSEDWLDE